MNVSDKDIYEYIVNLAEDKDVVNMLSVNRKFNDDSYFKKILEKRYPLLLYLKPSYETYKRFYLKMVTYLAKLWEEFKIPYIPSKNFDPESVYKAAVHKPDRIFTVLLLYAAEIGDIKLAEYLIDKGGKITLFAYNAAATEGKLDMLKFFIRKYPPPYIWLKYTLEDAKVANKQNIIDFLVNEMEVV